MADKPRMSPDAFSGARWSREQVMLAFHFYCQTPFGRLHGRNPEVIALAKLIGRTPGAVAMKCSNLASLDPAIAARGRKGLRGRSTLDEDVWDEFHADWERLALECEQLRQYLLRKKRQRGQAKAEDTTYAGLDPADYSGETRQALVDLRVKQAFFRRAVLSSYGGRCCISGVSEPRLLVASHIVPWREDKTNRLNPSNGLCLSAIHDKAFDAHLFTLTDDGRVVLSKRLKATKDAFTKSVFWGIEGQPITLPARFHPSPEFVARHRQTMLDKH